MSDPGALDRLPPVRAMMEAHGLLAKKGLGQNFLFDLNLTRRIARAGGPLDDATVLEIGPGPGGLSRALLAEGAHRVVAVERDTQALPLLAEVSAAAEGRLAIVAGDALALDHAALVQGGPARIVANLPYNIATPLLVGWLTAPEWPPFWRSATLMFQREVAERIVAPPGSKTYGRLSVLAGWRCRASLVFDVSPQAFFPPPKVTSSIVRLEPRTDALPLPPDAIGRVTAAAFGQRRKMLRSSLASVFPDVAAACAQAGVDPAARAETIPVEGFLALARLLTEGKGTG